MHGLAGKILIAAVAMAAGAGSIRADRGERGEVKVVRMRGNARYSVDQKKWKDLKTGTVLKSGTLIQTAPNSVVDVCLHDAHEKNPAESLEAATDDVIRLFENSVLSMDKLAEEEVQFDLRAGSLMGTVGRLSTDAKYEIKLPHGFAGIRGGTYIVDTSGGMNVFEGSAVVVIIGADNSLTTKKLGARQGYDPASGEVVALHLESYPLPLTCASTELPASATPSSPTSGKPHGSGMGGALRKF